MYKGTCVAELSHRVLVYVSLMEDFIAASFTVYLVSLLQWSGAKDQCLLVYTGKADRDLETKFI